MIAIRPKVKIRKESLIIFFLLLPHMRPESLAYIAPSLNTIYNISRVISFIVLVFLFIYRKVIPSPVMWIIVTLQLWILITTYLNSGDVQRAFINMMSVISFTMIIELYSSKRLIKPLMCNVEWMIYLNLATVILYPDGLYRRGVHEEFIDYFLGFKNAFFPYCILAILLAGLYYLQGKKSKKRSLLLMLASFLNVMVAWSASSVVAISVTVGLFLLIVVIQKPRFLMHVKFHTLIWFYILFDFLVCFFNIIENIPLISYFVTDILHKQTTLSGRTIIWELALKNISVKPWIGYGIGEHITWAGYDWYGHNQIFEILLEGGIPCLLLFIAVLLLISKKMNRCSSPLVYNMLISVYAGVFSFFIAEAGVSPIFYLIFAIAYHINDIVVSNGIHVNRGFLL